MTRELGRFDDELPERRRSGAGLGTILLVAAASVGLGLLAAPDTGVKTRRRLRHRLTALGADLGEGLEGMQEFSGRARERARGRLAALRRRARELEAEMADDEDEVEENEESDGLRTVLAMVAGVAATYFLASERAAPARTRVRETADNVRRQATDRWERFQRSRGNGFREGMGEGTETADEIRASDKPPLGS